MLHFLKETGRESEKGRGGKLSHIVMSWRWVKGGFEMWQVGKVASGNSNCNRMQVKFLTLVPHKVEKL